MSTVAATTVLVNLSVVLARVAQVIQLAQAEGREVSKEEMNKISSSYADSFIELNEAIRLKEEENG